MGHGIWEHWQTWAFAVGVLATLWRIGSRSGAAQEALHVVLVDAIRALMDIREEVRGARLAKRMDFGDAQKPNRGDK